MRITGILTIVCAAAIVAAFAVFPSRVCFSGGNNYTFYCGTSSADCREIKPVFNAEIERLFISDVCGESAEFAEFDLEKFLKGVNGKIAFTEKLSDSINYYCTADLPYSIEINGYEINLHICVRENGTKVASPIIFGGY